MMIATLTNFTGTVTPAVPSLFAVRCLTCHRLVMSGHGALDTSLVAHDCPDTTSQVRELEVTWEVPEETVEIPAPAVAMDDGS